jgi:hypothetical protein
MNASMATTFNVFTREMITHCDGVCQIDLSHDGLTLPRSNGSFPAAKGIARGATARGSARRASSKIEFDTVDMVDAVAARRRYSDLILYHRTPAMGGE